MEDSDIIALYIRRDELAIAETGKKYGAFCRKITGNLLSRREDAEECVNDAYYILWSRIPPEQPRSLQAFLGRILRNLAISRFRTNRAQKRYAGMELLLSELDDCLPDPDTVEQEFDRRQLSQLIRQWLERLDRDDRILFLRRYWYGDQVQTLARERSCSPNQMAQQMLRLRKSLKATLEAEGVVL